MAPIGESPTPMLRLDHLVVRAITALAEQSGAGIQVDHAHPRTSVGVGCESRMT